jgi:DNA repair protein SbcC/Rad50
MRPLELSLKGFRSYPGKRETVLDFRGRLLVGIVGPIGSGKSSILDAVSFALYGRTPSVTRDTRSLIHQRSDGGTVALRFEVEGQVWRVVRAMRRRGQSQHALYRLDGDGADPATTETVTGDREVTARVATLLAMDFDAFGRSVLLAQGEFDRFLSSPPVERDKVLKGVFGYDRIDRMREAARDRARDADLEADKIALRVQELDRIAADLEERRTAVQELAATVARLEEAAPRLVALDERVAAAAETARRAGARLQELAGLMDRVPGSVELEQMVAAATAAATRRGAAARVLEQAEQDRRRADRSLRAAEEDGTRERVERAAAMVATLEPLRAALADAARRHETRRTRRDTLATEATRAVERRTATERTAAERAAATAEAQRALTAAEEALHAARHADMALTLRRGLAAGAACPVCAQEVTTLPEAGDAAGLEAAERAWDEARRRRDEAERASRTAATEATAATEGAAAAARAVESAESDVAEAAAAMAAAGDAVAAVEAELVSLLGDGDPAAVLARQREALSALEAAAQATAAAAQAAREEHDEAILAGQEAGRRLGEVRMVLAGVAARLGDDAGIPDDDPAGLAAAEARLREMWKDASGSAEKERAAAVRAGEEAATTRRAILADLEVEGEFAAALAAARAEHAVASAAVARSEKAVAGRDEVVATHSAATDRKDRLDRLAADLTDSRFIRYLLDEERARLADLGSDHFQRLSAGRYRFTEDGAFEVVDLTAADAVRKSDSLSGGETFLASLALAISLAEMVARTGGRLDAFFLDEGFGSLDPEHLDLAMEGIEALVAEHEDRLVVVVSHVPEMRSRVEDLIVLDKDAATGDTIVRHGAGGAG